MNLIFFVPLSLMLERAKGSINLIGYLLGIHVTVLLLLSTLTFYRIIPSAYYFGLSHMVFGVLSLWSMQNKKFLLVALMASFLVFQFFETSSSTSVLPHALAFILGLIHGLFFNKSRQVVRRAQSAHR